MARLVELTVRDDPARWRAAGFDVDPSGACRVGAVTVQLEAPDGDGRTGVTGWRFDGLEGDREEIDGIPTGSGPGPTGAPPVHPNGATSVDHVVVTTPDVDRTVAALEESGLRALREREAEAGGRPVRQVFLRPGEAVIEVVGPREPGGHGAARFFGLTFTVADLDAASDLLGDDLGRVKDAVQPGRRIATVRSSAGLGLPVALMSREPGR